MQKAAKVKVSQIDVLNQIVKTCQDKRIYVTYKGKKIIPTKVEQLPRSLNLTSNLMYKQAYSKLWYAATTKVEKKEKTKKGRWSGKDSMTALRMWKTGSSTEEIMAAVKRGRNHVHQKLQSLRAAEGITVNQTTYMMSKKLKSIELTSKETKPKARETRVEPMFVPEIEPQVNAKTLVVNLSSTITATITEKGLITVDFK